MPDLGRLPRKRDIILVKLALYVLFYQISLRLVSLDNMSAISRQIVPIGLIALVQFFVVGSGCIDLSVGMGSVLSAIVLGVVAVIAFPVALGFSNGTLVQRRDAQ